MAERERIDVAVASAVAKAVMPSFPLKLARDFLAIVHRPGITEADLENLERLAESDIPLPSEGRFEDLCRHAQGLVRGKGDGHNIAWIEDPYKPIALAWREGRRALVK